jgi:hypothetical protein
MVITMSSDLRPRPGVSLWAAQLQPEHTVAKTSDLKPRFEALGIDPDDYVMYVSPSEYRLKPFGLHTGPSIWLKEQRQFFNAHPKASQDQFFELPHKMLTDRGF